MSARTVHVCLSVRGALRWPKRQLARWAKGSTAPDGRPATADDLRDFLMDELAQGHEVIPLGDPCEGFDFKKGCPGHPRPTPSSAAADAKGDGKCS